MKNLIYFFAGIILVTLVSATTVNVMTIKPQQPKQTIVVSGWNTQELNTNIKPYIQKGFIVKNLSVGDGCRAVILEKY